jgi:hypothetical protein
MADLVRPFERVWEWVDRTGGYPGKVFLGGLVVLVAVSAFTWYSNRR